jgi:thioredoxin 1
MATIKSTDETFEKLKKENKNLLLDMWAPWCGPCLQISPVLEQISEEMKEVAVAKHNIDEEPNVPTQFAVKGIPTMILFVDGEQKAVKVGASNKADLVDFLKKNI